MNVANMHDFLVLLSGNDALTWLTVLRETDVCVAGKLQ
jgi:hypothetical protein